MCDKCSEINGQIERYRRMADLLMDTQTVAGLRKLIADLEATRARLHAQERSAADRERGGRTLQ